MTATSEDRWAALVRVLLLALTFVTVVAVLEAAAIRSLRSELQLLRTERQTTQPSP